MDIMGYSNFYRYKSNTYWNKMNHEKIKLTWMGIKYPKCSCVYSFIDKHETRMYRIKLCHFLCNNDGNFNYNSNNKLNN